MGRGRMLAPMTAERTYTIREAAELAGVTEKAIQRRIEDGKMPHSKRGRIRVVTHADLHAAYPGKVPPTPEPLEAPTGDIDAPNPPAESVREKAPTRRRDPELTDVVLALTSRLEHLSGELSTHRLLATQAENRARMERQANEETQREILEARARVLELEAVAEELRRQLSAGDGRGRPGWFRRTFGAQGGQDGADRGAAGG